MKKAVCNIVSLIDTDINQKVQKMFHTLATSTIIQNHRNCPVEVNKSAGECLS